MEQKSENQALLNLIKKLKEDPTLMKKFLTSSDSESMYNIAISISDGYNKQEFLEFMKYLKSVNEQRSADNHMSQLDENSLDKISGGSKFGKFLDDTCEFLDCGGANILNLLVNL